MSLLITKGLGERTITSPLSIKVEKEAIEIAVTIEELKVSITVSG
jgi:hypothetical protein